MNARAKMPVGQREKSLRSSPSQSSAPTLVTEAMVSIEMPRRSRSRPQPRTKGIPVGHGSVLHVGARAAPTDKPRFSAGHRSQLDPICRSFAIQLTDFALRSPQSPIDARRRYHSSDMAASCLSVHASYRCQHAGECCTAGWPIPIDSERVFELRTRGLLTDAHTRALRDEDGMAVSLRKTSKGACVFYGMEHDGLCGIQRDAGARLMPSACRNFPRVALRDPRGIFVTLSHFCPTAAGLLLSADAIAIVLAPASISLDGEVEGLDATGVMPPLLRSNMLMDWDGYGVWERESLAVLNDRRYSARAALDIISTATRHARTWSPGRSDVVRTHPGGIQSHAIRERERRKVGARTIGAAAQGVPGLARVRELGGVPRRSERRRRTTGAGIVAPRQRPDRPAIFHRRRPRGRLAPAPQRRACPSSIAFFATSPLTRVPTNVRHRARARRASSY